MSIRPAPLLVAALLATVLVGQAFAVAHRLGDDDRIAGAALIPGSDATAPGCG